MRSPSTPAITRDPETWQAAMLDFCGQKSVVEFRPVDFAGALASWRMGGVNIARMHHNLKRMCRPSVAEGHHKERNVILLFQRAGRSSMCQDGVSVELHPGDAILLDSHREFSGAFDTAVKQALCYLPAEEVIGNGGMGKLPRLRTHRGNSLLGRLAGGLINAVLEQGPDVGVYDGAHGRRVLIELARGLLDQQRPRSPSNPDEPQNWWIRQYIDAHLADPALTPAKIAEGCQISVRRLHRVFAGSNWSACQWVREQRLHKCYADLKNSDLAHQTITEIAFRWGFNDSAHFSRSFREKFGRSPSEVRRECLTRIR